MENMRDAGKFSKDAGFTLTEVILAILITGILLVVSLRFFTEQWRSGQGLRERVEAHYAVMTGGRTVSDAIRAAESVQWSSGTGILTVKPSGTDFTDRYYIADKDYDGIKDLYREHLGVPSPLVSGVVEWECAKGESGLWRITLKGRIGTQNVDWQGQIRQRATPVVNSVMSPF
jgi:prepilin-type N-terminal cleavage/methylation domain-containing protein